LEVANHALEEAILVDPLTGLHNRRFLDLSLPLDALQAQRAFRESLDAGLDPLAPKDDLILFLMDIDHFKLVNDTYGHLAGDAVLMQLALALNSAIRATDSLVRWGGEEFLLVARRARRSGAHKVAQHMLEVARGMTFQLPGGERIEKKISIGFAALPLHPLHPDVGTWQQGLELADQCLYAAKTSGRDRWVGALLKSDQDPAPLFGMESWDVATANELGLVDLLCSQPDFQWPVSPTQ
jgi:diguanylate cyclase (GGDEF)-like protein